MATQKTNMFDKMISKYKDQYMLKKLEGISMTMDGHIALQSGDGEFTAIVDDHLETYPAEMIIPNLPFYSIQRNINFIREGDYVFLNNTTEGRKLAKVSELIKKSGKVTGLNVIRFNGSQEESVVTTDKLTGITTVEVVINLMDCIGDMPGMDNPNGMNPWMMMAMFNDGKMDMEKIFMMMMCMGGQNPFQMFQQGMNAGQEKSKRVRKTPEPKSIGFTAPTQHEEAPAEEAPAEE